MESQPDNYFLNFALGRWLAVTGSGGEAIEYLEKAIYLFPSLAGSESRYAVLAVLFRLEGLIEEETQIRYDWWNQAPLFVTNALRLAEVLQESNRLSEALVILENVMYLDPFSMEAHTRLGRL